ncbi:MAG: cysteine methyltransferase [Flavobacteria bacterium RIFCSPLOWO2_12_FULL_35_11]|nr:MAG: cysteine methyltransferase [Flavobacteria bacterium RIFCSPLOWO2_12_FULL_35_11]
MFLESNQTTYYKTPIGTAKIVGDENGISAVTVINDAIETSAEIPEILQDCVQQLTEYFNGTRREFNLKLNPHGTDFQKRVWKELLLVPYGKTRTYLEQSKQLGDVKAIRAVASSNGKNPIWILIPCHRIIGSDGSLTGYAGGIWRKKWLLEHENPSTQQSLF